MICHLEAAADNSDSGGGPEVTHQPLGCVGLLGVGLVGKAALGIDQRAGVVGVGDAGRGGGELLVGVWLRRVVAGAARSLLRCAPKGSLPLVCLGSRSQRRLPLRLAAAATGGWLTRLPARVSIRCTGANR